MTMQVSPPNPKKMFKVLCPIERKDGSTFWMRVGIAFPNRDQSINLYLDALPFNQKLQVREMDEDDLREREGKRRDAGRPSATTASAAADKNLPF
jgi:hypothetical protein